MQEKINIGEGEARAVEAHARATAEAVREVAAALQAEGAHEASTLRVAEHYVRAFNKLAASGSTVVVPANASDVGAMVAQAMAIYRGRGGDAKPLSELGAGSDEISASEITSAEAAGAAGADADGDAAHEAEPSAAEAYARGEYGHGTVGGHGHGGQN